MARMKHTLTQGETTMEKPGLEHAVMILGAGATALHLMRNYSFKLAKKNIAVVAADKVSFSALLTGISGWTGRVIMALILISCTYHMFATGINAVYCLGIAASAVYFAFFSGIRFPKAVITAGESVVKS